MNDPVSVPLGFWLRTVDSLFEWSMDELFTAEGVTRRLWQVLSSVKRNEPASTTDIDQAMAMFLNEGVPSSRPLLDELATRGWAELSEGFWMLTNAGRVTVAGLEEKVARHRKVMFRDVDDTAYRTTVETLARITSNLDPQGQRTPTFR